MKRIIEKYHEGRASEPEMKELLEWLRKKDNHFQFHSFRLDWRNRLVKTGFPAESRESWFHLQEQLSRKSFTQIQSTNRAMFIFKVAAIFFFVAIMGISAFYFAGKQAEIPEFYTSVIAENGQISKAVLPDGSTVWLNSGSEISYSSQFAADNRDIKLIGEAYFRVTKNKDLPMVVSCGELQVKVLGTQFNVTAYPETGVIDVVLEKGAVQLLNSNVGSFSYNLKPGERANFNSENRNVTVSNVNTVKFTSWKDGIINIYNQTLEELLTRLELRVHRNIISDN